jgi:hypothetical protein
MYYNISNFIFKYKTKRKFLNEQNFEPTIFLKCPTFLGDIIKININMNS